MDNLGEKMEKEEIECLINEIDIDGELSSTLGWARKTKVPNSELALCQETPG